MLKYSIKYAPDHTNFTLKKKLHTVGGGTPPFQTLPPPPSLATLARGSGRFAPSHIYIFSLKRTPSWKKLVTPLHILSMLVRFVPLVSTSGYPRSY